MQQAIRTPIKTILASALLWLACAAASPNCAYADDMLTGSRTTELATQSSTYTIVYHLNGGTFDGSVRRQYTIGKGLGTLPTPIKAGYSFIGWYSNSKLTKHMMSIPRTAKGKVHLYAKWRKRKLIAHRGYCAHAPENSVQAIIDAAKKGFKYIEVDVRFTADKMPVLSHDNTLVTVVKKNGKLLKKRVRLSKIRYANLKKARLFKDGSIVSGRTIVSFASMVALCKQFNIRPYLDIKEGNHSKIKHLMRVLKREGMQSSVRWLCHSVKRLMIVKRFDSDASISYQVGRVSKKDIRTAQKLARGGSDVVIGVPRPLVSKNAVRLCREAGIPMEVWRVGTERSFRTLDSYISGLMVNSLAAPYVPSRIL